MDVLERVIPRPKRDAVMKFCNCLKTWQRTDVIQLAIAVIYTITLFVLFFNLSF